MNVHRIGGIELHGIALRHARQVGTPLIGTVHVDPTTGDTVRRITRASAMGTHYPPCVPCPECIGFPCEHGLAGEGC